MGQYYRALVIDKNDYHRMLNPHEFGEGAKLMEHAWIGNIFASTVYSLIHNNPCIVSWVGDYSDNPYKSDTDAYAKAMPEAEFLDIFQTVWFRLPSMDLGDFTREQRLLVNMETMGSYLVNHDLKCAIDIEAYIEHAAIGGKWCINPLPLLTACGNLRGNGDFDGKVGLEDVGTWAFHRIEFTDQCPEDYTMKEYRFIEK